MRKEGELCLRRGESGILAFNKISRVLKGKDSSRKETPLEGKNISKIFSKKKEYKKM